MGYMQIIMDLGERHQLDTEERWRDIKAHRLDSYPQIPDICIPRETTKFFSFNNPLF